MNALHRDVLNRLLEFVPDVRAFACVCKWSHAETTDHPDMLYWRGGDSRERYLTAKIYADFKCAKPVNLIKYDRADIFLHHRGDRVREHLGLFIKHDARKIIDAVSADCGDLWLHHYADSIKSGEQLRYLRSKFNVRGESTAIHEAICDGNIELVVEIGRVMADFPEQMVVFALTHGAPAIIDALVGAGIIGLPRVHRFAVEQSKYGLFDILLKHGHTMEVPEDIVADVIPELSPAGLRALAANQDITSAITDMFAIKLAGVQKLVPVALELGARPTPEDAADHAKYAADVGDLEALLALRMYLRGIQVPDNITTS